VRGYEFLKQRAQEFFARSLEDLERGRTNLSAFDLEQALQLFLKYLIALKIGEWPKTHLIEELVELVGELYDRKRIEDYIHKKSWFLDEISSAYYISRYLPREYRKETIATMIKETHQLLQILEELSGKNSYNTGKMVKKPNLVSLVSSLLEKKGRFFRNSPEYLRKIKEEAIRLFGEDARVLLFGSFLRGEATLRSDMDILILSDRVPADPEKESRLKAEIKGRTGGILAPFQIHFSTHKEYEEWYSRFIKDEFVEI
jgi:HEPN domain-containing protein